MLLVHIYANKGLEKVATSLVQISLQHAPLGENGSEGRAGTCDRTNSAFPFYMPPLAEEWKPERGSQSCCLRQSGSRRHRLLQGCCCLWDSAASGTPSPHTLPPGHCCWSTGATTAVSRVLEPPLVQLHPGRQSLSSHNREVPSEGANSTADTASWTQETPLPPSTLKKEVGARKSSGRVHAPWVGDSSV